MIAGLDSVDSGDIFLGDQSVRALPPHKRDIALVAVEIPLLPHLTVAANITLPLELRRTAKDTVSRRLRKPRSTSGSAPCLTAKPPALSETDRVRVALARALALQPKAILLDDPLSALDPAARRHLRVELARLHQQFRATIILATTDASEPSRSARAWPSCDTARSSRSARRWKSTALRRISSSRACSA